MLCQDGKKRHGKASLRLLPNSYGSVISSLPSARGKPKASSRTPAIRPTHQPHCCHLENVSRSWFNHKASPFQGPLLPTGSRNNEFIHSHTHTHAHTQAFILFWAFKLNEKAFLFLFFFLYRLRFVFFYMRDGAEERWRDNHFSQSEEGSVRLTEPHFLSHSQKCWQGACLSRTEAVRQRSAAKSEQNLYL